MGMLEFFEDVEEYNLFSTAFLTLMFLEAVIIFFTYKKRIRTRRSDKFSIYVIITGWIFCLPSGMFFRQIPFISDFLLPRPFFFLGIMMIYIGILIRVLALLTIKKEYTSSVMLGEKQKLVTTGIYSIVRNPAYFGSILSITGISICYRNIFALIFTNIVCFFCYRYRISVEEDALRRHFGEEFEIYCKKTRYRIIPFII